MRMMVDFSLPVEPFNTLVKEGKAGEKIQQIMEDINPEAVYFSERQGRRGGIMIVEVADPSKVPSIAEPLFLTFNASVEFHIVMNAEELRQARLDELGQKYA